MSGGTLHTLPPAERFAHGTRARYVGARCRCTECRAANTRAYHERMARAKAAALELAPGATCGPCPGIEGKPCPRGSRLRKDSTGGICERCRALLIWDGLVDAEPVRRHIRELSALGVGRRSISAATDIRDRTLFAIATGKQQNVRNQLAKRILAVDRGAVADHGIVPGEATWELLDQLLQLGLTKGEIAQQLGNIHPALQIRKRAVLALTAQKVAKLHRAIVSEFRKRLEIRDEIANAAELGAGEFFGTEGFSFIRRPSAIAPPPTESRTA